MTFKGVDWYKVGGPPLKTLDGLYMHELQGRLMLLADGMVVCPFEMRGTSGPEEVFQELAGRKSRPNAVQWSVVVVIGNRTYRRGGYHIIVHETQFETSREIKLQAADHKFEANDHNGKCKECGELPQKTVVHLDVLVQPKTEGEQ